MDRAVSIRMPVIRDDFPITGIVQCIRISCSYRPGSWLAGLFNDPVVMCEAQFEATSSRQWDWQSVSNVNGMRFNAWVVSPADIDETPRNTRYNSPQWPQKRFHGFPRSDRHLAVFKERKERQNTRNAAFAFSSGELAFFPNLQEFFSAHSQVVTSYSVKCRAGFLVSNPMDLWQVFVNGGVRHGAFILSRRNRCSLISTSALPSVS